MTSLLVSILFTTILVLALVFMGVVLFGLFGEAPRFSGRNKGNHRDTFGGRMP